MLHAYNQVSLEPCLSSHPWVFIGDSVTRQLYYETAHMMDFTLQSAALDDKQKHGDQVLRTANGTDILFFWDPFLNSTHVPIYTNDRDTARSADKDPVVVVLGTGLWFLRHPTSSGGLSRWGSRIESVLSMVAHASHRTPKEIYILPVVDVIPSKLSPARASTMLISDIDAMNTDLVHRASITRQLTGASVFIPQVFNAMLDASQTDDGLHFSGQVIRAQAGILLNRVCNKHRPPTPPFDTTCCREYPALKWPQELALLVFIGVGLILWLLSISFGSSSNSPLVFAMGTTKWPLY
jgi:hypothetical protein